MIDIVLKSNKTIRRTKHEDIYEGENKISWINVYLPETINDIDIKDYNIVLRCYINADNYIPYTLDTTKSINKIDITHEFTDKDRYIDAYLYITRADEVIGKTNTVSFRVNKAKDGSGLTPREHLDERIAELENENEGLEREVAEQATAIEAKDGQISELNGQVTELEAENAEQTQTIIRQNTTIDELNTRRIPVYIEPNLESKEITPLAETRYYGPSEGKDGFSSVTVDGVTVEGLGLNENYYKLGEPFLNKVGTYHPFPENTYGGIYFTELNENDFPVGIKVVNYDYNYNNFSIPGLNMNTLRNNIKSFILLDCKNVNIADNYFNGAQLLTTCRFDGVLRIGGGAFNNCTSLMELTLPDSLKSIGNFAFQYCSNLTEVNIPNSLTSIGQSTFLNCSGLTNLTLAQGFNCDGLNVYWATRLTAETIVACLEALADRTGQTAYTITFGSTNLNKLTAEQRAIATNKNWNLA